MFIDVAVDYLSTRIGQKKRSLFTLATGQSPLEVYQRWTQKVIEQRISTDLLEIHQLDEWVGLPRDHEATCERFLRKHVIEPLAIDEQRFHSIHSDTLDPQAEATRISQVLAGRGYADVTVLGIGKNGHLGLNEPDDRWYPTTHVATLSEASKRHSMLAGSVVGQGITTGMAEIMASRALLVLVSGEGKDVKRLADATISTDFPASCIHLHPNVTIVLDIPYSQGIT